MKKMLTHVFGGPTMRAILDKWGGGGVNQFDQIGPVLTFNNIFLCKVKIQRGYILWKKIAISYN